MLRCESNFWLLYRHKYLPTLSGRNYCMKYSYRLAILVLLFLSPLIFLGCGKSAIQGFKPEGRSLSLANEMSHHNAETVVDSQTFVGEESLANVGNNDIYGLAADTDNDRYKREFGRSTAPLMPIYFDFDRDAIRDDQVEILNRNGNYLIDNRVKKIIIAGNCDERGTSEYNMGLGERRAINAKHYLIKIGVSAERIRTLSFGDEMPLNPGSNEWAWSRNRRADFVIE